MGREVPYPMPDDIREQVETAYRRMAEEARYRPAAPSDGMGGITVPAEELSLDKEARDYADRWWKNEWGDDYQIGIPNYPTRAGMVYALELARLCCSGSDAIPHALAVARLAVKELEVAEKEDAEREARQPAT